MLTPPSNRISNSSKIRQKLSENRAENCTEEGYTANDEKPDLLDFIEERKKLETYVQMVLFMLK